MVRRIPFKNNFVFTYSPRPGTPAIKRLEDDIPGPVKRRRINELLAIQGEVSSEVHRSFEGTVQDVFVERVSPLEQRRPGGVELGWEGPSMQLSGRTPGDLITVFQAPEGVEASSLIGRILPVHIHGSAPRLLMGSLKQSELSL